MLALPRDLRDLVVAHAKRDHPDEACGILAGPVGADRPTRFVPVPNASATPYTRYEFGSADLLAVYREISDRDEEPVVIYHSHTHTEAAPSPTDVSLAAEPDAHYLLISTREHGNDPGPVELRSFRIRDGEVHEEEIELLP